MYNKTYFTCFILSAFITFSTGAFAEEETQCTAKRFLSENTYQLSLLKTSNDKAQIAIFFLGDNKGVNRSGCCSWHQGVCGCSNGRALCCDGTLSPTCGCN